MKRVLIFGKDSYIGTSFERYIKNAGNNLRIEEIDAKENAWKDADWTGVDAIIHVAAIVHKKEEPHMEQLYEAVNTILPVAVAKKAKNCGVKHFVFFSTMAVYGEQESPITLDMPEKPITMYGKSKLEAELQLQKLAEETFKVHILRPPMVYGPGCPGNYARLAKMAHVLPLFPKVRNQRSMIYIANLCEGILQEIYMEEADCRILCPQNEEYVNTTELVKEIRRAKGKYTLTVPVPQGIVNYLVRRMPVVEKVFGNCFYAKNMDDKRYQKFGFVDSVIETEKGVL